MIEKKCICQSCDWQGLVSELLVAKSPFDPDETVNGCPKCRSIDAALVACDEPVGDDLIGGKWRWLG
jgi:Zn finger protein HypA/HybF involved in hydrogenase expression